MGHRKVLVTCPACGNSRMVQARTLKRSSFSGLCKSCNGRRSGNVSPLPSGEACVRKVYRAYRQRASSRLLPFTLDLEHFRVLTSSPCHYCGAPPSNVEDHADLIGSYVYSGIDRVDNLDGYTATNSRPCCYTCNKAKGTMSEGEFLAWLQRASHHRCST